MTLEAWVNPSTVTSAWRDVIYKGDDIYYLEGTSTSGGVAAMGGTFSPSPLYGTATPPVNTWTHLAATYDGVIMRLYVNGAQVASRAQTGNILTSTNPLQIGGDGIYGQYFQGMIDEVRVYNVALTQLQIQADMATPIGGTPSDTTPPQVVITFPLNNTQVNDIVTVTAEAYDNVGVSGVQFLVDNVNVGVEDTNPPYGLSWDTRTVTNGAHILTARAHDASGNTAFSAPVAVNVANANFFQNEILATGFGLPTSIKFLPDGRMLVVELQGTIKVLPPPYTQPDTTLFLQLTNVGSAGVQQGVYDIVLDPDFVNNHFYYVFYTAASPNRDRLSRLTANASLTGTVAGSELILYQDPQNANPEHHGGAVNFGNDGKIYFTTGEHFNAGESQLLSSPRGKIHRINKDGTVPTDNPFYDGTGPNWDSIWALGLRNPYRAYYDAPTSRLIIGDVGGNDYSVAKEEVNLGVVGANYGWPNSEGPCSAPCTSPIYFYPHNGRDACVTGGFVYHGTQFPSSYQGSYFFADYTQNWIRRLTFDANGNVNGVFNFEPADGTVDGPYGDIVYLTEGPDGALYYVDLGYSDIGGTFGVSKIRRIRYVQSNQAPIAIASANPTSGATPLTVSFSSTGSLDPEGQPITYFWTFGDGATSTDPNPVYTYTQTGQYTVRLTVSDGVNSTLSTPLYIGVGNKPTATILSPQDGSLFIAGDTIFFSGDATDVEDGTLPASAFTWNIDFLHEGHVHPGIPLTGVKSGSFDIPTSGHDFSGNTRYRIQLTATDSDGLQGTQSVMVYPQKVNLTFDSSPTGLILTLDGIDRTTPFVHDTLVNFTHTIEAPNQTQGQNAYTFGSWSDGGAQQHVITVPATAQSYTALYTVTQNPLPAGLVAGWSFNEGTGTSASDASGNNNILTLLNGATWTGGHHNGGLSLSGNANASASSSVSLNLSGSYTLTAWINPSSLTGYQTVLIKENSSGGGGCGYWLQTVGNQISSGFNNGSGCSEHTANANLQTNAWYHIAAVFDDTGNTYQIYLNGNLLTSQLEATVPIPNNQNLTIGRTAFGENWNGLLDEVRIYNRALSQAEIQADMNTPLP
jgi:glucose/arabinose dehydrogenase